MKKKINIDSITNELEGASLFFTRPSAPVSGTTAQTSAASPQSQETAQADPSNRQQSGLADSPFFTPPVQVATPAETPLPDPQPVQIPNPSRTKERIEKKTIKKENSIKKDSGPETRSLNNHESVVPHTQAEIIEMVRKATKELGKEAATHRFTVAEKRHIAEIIYTYKTQGIKTTENEIARIAVNYLIEDYKANGENSLLDRILKVLNK